MEVKMQMYEFAGEKGQRRIIRVMYRMHDVESEKRNCDRGPGVARSEEISARVSILRGSGTMERDGREGERDRALKGKRARTGGYAHPRRKFGPLTILGKTARSILPLSDKHWETYGMQHTQHAASAGCADAFSRSKCGVFALSYTLRESVGHGAMLHAKSRGTLCHLPRNTMPFAAEHYAICRGTLLLSPRNTSLLHLPAVQTDTHMEKRGKRNAIAFAAEHYAICRGTLLLLPRNTMPFAAEHYHFEARIHWVKQAPNQETSVKQKHTPISPRGYFSCTSVHVRGKGNGNAGRKNQDYVQAAA